MSSLRRIESSRANGRRSHGPVTPDGKLRSSQNALKHGLLADVIVLPGESPEGFDQLCEAHVTRFQPVDDVELSMLEELSAAYWRLRRGWAMENEILAEAMDSQPAAENLTETARLTAAFRQLATAPELALLHRYETRLHNIYNRTLRSLILVRKAAPSPPPPPPEPEPEPEPAPVAEAQPAPNRPVPNEPNPISGHSGPQPSPCPPPASVII